MKIRTKITLLMTAVIGLVVAGMLAALVALERRQLNKNAKEHIASAMTNISRAAAESLSLHDDLMLLSYLRFQMKQLPELEICMVTRNGYTTVLGKVNSDLDYRTVSASAAGEQVAVQAGFSKDYTEARLREEDMKLAAVVLGMAALGLALGFAASVFISRKFSDPVTELSEAASRLGRGDLAASVPVRGADEIAALGATFNNMAASLRDLIMAKEDLLSTLTHELNNPLAGLKAYIALLRDPGRIATIAETRQAYETMADAVGQMELTLSNALELFRTSAKPELDLEIVDLAAMAREVTGLYSPVARSSHIELKLELPEHGLSLIADRKLLRRVMVNLVSNALKYTPERGAISVVLSAKEGCAEFRVSDNGYGISKEDQQHLFTKFFRTRGPDGKRNKIPGSGLGLPIVKQAIELHRGSVRVESEKGKGSTFIVSLPKSDSGDCL